ncbi:hypothetical protein GCM10012289_32280 [Nonomuraea cavernae]|uniref:Uncharacterized protein n=1 Tax=Nonomuraea cavernae TaxID=2045107 RepID=A0A918DJD5_9ACTN|nr:hypothetical protein GCM10012289_32280 [Nonomuraea cavernae]
MILAHRITDDDGTSDARGLTCWPVGRKNVLASEKGVHFRLAEPPMPSGGTDTTDAACRSPARNCLWVYPEEGGNLSRGQQTLAATLHQSLPLASRFLPAGGQVTSVSSEA